MACTPALPSLPQDSDTPQPDRIELLQLFVYGQGDSRATAGLQEPVTVAGRMALRVKLFDQNNTPLGNQLIDAIVVESEVGSRSQASPLVPVVAPVPLTESVRSACCRRGCRAYSNFGCAP